MSSRQGPITDASGTYYVITEDDGSTHKEYVNPSNEATSTTISANGDVVQPQATAAQPHVATAPPPGQLDNVGGVDPTDDVDAAYGGKSGYSSGHSYRSGGYTGNGGDSYDQGSANYPSYANGQLHPAWGGPPLVPGGAAAAAAAAAGTNTGQQQVSVPGGAAAGPYSTRGAYPPDTPAYGGGGPSLDSGSASGGGHTSAAYDALRAKGGAMASKVRSMGAGGSSSSSSYDSGSSQQYRRQQRRIGNAYDKYNEALAEPNYLKVHGILKQEGVSKEGAMGILGHPEMLLNALGEHIDPNNPADLITQNLPATDLALLSRGTQGRAMMSKTPVDKVPGILRKQGVKPTKPDYKRTLDPSKVANQIANVYQQFGRGELPTADDLLGNLATLKRKSAVGQGLEVQDKTDPNAAVSAVRNYLQSAVLGTQHDDLYADVEKRSIDAALANSGTTLLSRRPKRFNRSVQDVAKGLV